jgi:hypothetical protein
MAHIIGFSNQQLFRCMARSESLESLIGSFTYVIDRNRLNIGTSLIAAACPVPDFIVRVKGGATGPERQVLLNLALTLDQRLKGWVSVTPARWQYTRLSTMEDWLAGNVYGFVDIYNDIRQANVWNSYRMAHILVLDGLVQLLMLRPGSQQHLVKYALDTLQVLADDVCASVPFHLGDQMSPYPDIEIRYPEFKDPTSAYHKQMAFVYDMLM